jgi:hypothetical protein
LESPLVKIAIEWPNGCRYWSHLEVKKFIVKQGLVHLCRFDGCAYGLTQLKDGLPILKPWRVMTNDAELVLALNLRCSKDHQHGSCEGKNASASAHYTHDMVQAIHKAWRKSSM